jgi:hypothetical protein
MCGRLFDFGEIHPCYLALMLSYTDANFSVAIQQSSSINILFHAITGS